MSILPTQRGDSRTGHGAASLDHHDRQRCWKRQIQADAILAQVGHELVRSLDTTDTRAEVCRVTVEALQCDYSCLLLWQLREAAYVPVASHGVGADHWGALRELKLSQAVMRGFIERLERETVVQLRAALVGTTHGVPLTIKYGTSASIHTVLRRGADTIGVLVAGYRHRAESFTPGQEYLARGIAQLAAMSLDSAAHVRELRQASASKSELVATVSHELRTPLNVILGYNDLLVEEAYGPLTASQRATLQQVEDSAHELLDLVDALLDFSRVEHGRIALDLRETDVAKLVREIEVQMQPLREQAGLTFDCRLSASLAPVRTDRTLLKVLLRNLIVNAFKFTTRGGVTVAVGSRDGGIEIAVADTGIGMAPETLRLIFEPFRQAHPAHPHNRTGVGLGLFIVRRILETLNGTIRVDSTVGRGSTFRVWLPHSLPPASEAHTAAGCSPQLQGSSDCAAAG